MWPFSDRETSRAIRATIKYLKRLKYPKHVRKKVVKYILEGFEEGFNKFQRRFNATKLSQCDTTLSRCLDNDAIGYAARGMDNGIFDVQSFGACLGSLVGIFKFHPISILESQWYWCILYINSLKNKPKFHKMILEIVSEWDEEIKKRGFHNKGEEENYRKFMAGI